jgi:hypothetical protein
LELYTIVVIYDLLNAKTVFQNSMSSSQDCCSIGTSNVDHQMYSPQPEQKLSSDIVPIMVDSSVQEQNNTKATFSKLGSYEASKNYRNSQIYSLSEISSRQTHNLLHFLEKGEGKSKNS